MISSLSNPRVKNIIQLQSKAKARNEQDVFVIEGIKMFFEIPKDRILEAYVSEGFYLEKLQINEDYFHDYQVEIIKDSIFKQISDTKTPQGILAIVKKPHYDFYEIIKNQAANLVVLEDIRDPGNLGTIVRTAEGAGITGVILSKDSVDIFNPKVIRSTMGSIYRMPFVYVEDIVEAIKEMKENGIVLYAAHLSGERFYDELEYKDQCGILIGNEANGLSDAVSMLANNLIKIPMAGSVESLNAAIAAAILMYEVNKHKR